MECNNLEEYAQNISFFITFGFCLIVSIIFVAYHVFYKSAERDDPKMDELLINDLCQNHIDCETESEKQLRLLTINNTRFNKFNTGMDWISYNVVNGCPNQSVTQSGLLRQTVINLGNTTFEEEPTNLNNFESKYCSDTHRSYKKNICTAKQASSQLSRTLDLSEIMKDQLEVSVDYFGDTMSTKCCSPSMSSCRKTSKRVRFQL